MNINAQGFVYCPVCALTLETTREEDREIKYCRRHGKFYPKHDIAVAGIIIHYDDYSSSIEPFCAVLMVKRNKEPNKNKWSFPAGFVNFGEHPDNALIREVREETGLTVVRSKLIKEVISDDDPRSPKQLSRFYKVFATGEVKIQDKEENGKFAWWVLDPTNPIPNIAWNNHKKIYKDLRLEFNALGSLAKTDPWLSAVR